jgi:hypothetical protein
MDCRGRERASARDDFTWGKKAARLVEMHREVLNADGM